MSNVRGNRKNAYYDLKRPLGCSHLDTQQELLWCKTLISKLKYQIEPNTKYKHIFSSSLKKQKWIVEVFSDIFCIREKILEKILKMPGIPGTIALCVST